jgi:hypothetical protein
MSVPEDIEQPDEDESMMEEPAPPGEQRKESNPTSDSELLGSVAIWTRVALLESASIACTLLFLVIYDPLICLTFNSRLPVHTWHSL